jgi:glyoxylate carboligase
MENAMTKKAGKLTTLAAATVLGTMFAGTAMAQAATANVGVNAGTTAAAGTGGISGVTSILTGLLGDVTGLLGGLGLGGIL